MLPSPPEYRGRGEKRTSRSPNVSRIPYARSTMLHNVYRFLSHWRVQATPEEVFRIIENWSGMPQWWPAAVVRAEVLHPGDANGVGSVCEMHTRGWLPYVIRTKMETVEKDF